MRSLALIGLAFFAVIGLARADDPDPTFQSLQTDFLEATPPLVYRRSDLPGPIADYFLSRESDEGTSVLAEVLAEPDEDFNPGCVVERGTPSARLVFAGASADVSFALVEQGGYAHSLSLILLGLGENAGRRCLYSLLLEDLGLSELKERIRAAQARCQ